MATSSISSFNRVGSQRVGSFATWFTRIVLLPPTLIMILIGVRYISHPTQGAAATGVTLSTPEAVTDTRVVGALALTIAFVIASSMASPGRLRMGHLTIIALMASILAVRMFGFAHDGTTLAMGDQKVKVTGEIVFLALNVLALALQSFRLKKDEARQ